MSKLDSKFGKVSVTITPKLHPVGVSPNYDMHLPPTWSWLWVIACGRVKHLACIPEIHLLVDSVDLFELPQRVACCPL
jgi:hypothetical protein